MDHCTQYFNQAHHEQCLRTVSSKLLIKKGAREDFKLRHSKNLDFSRQLRKRRVEDEISRKNQ